MRIAPEPLSPHVTNDTPLSRGRRVSLWLIAWVTAGVATVVPNFILVFFCLLFPLGLAAPFGASDWDSSPANMTIVIGWGVYIALSIYGLKQRQRARYMAAYILLIVFLILNVAGCRYEAAHIHINC